MSPLWVFEGLVAEWGFAPMLRVRFADLCDGGDDLPWNEKISAGLV
jgi:hypothetical protein